MKTYFCLAVSWYPSAINTASGVKVIAANEREAAKLACQENAWKSVKVRENKPLGAALAVFTKYTERGFNK